MDEYIKREALIAEIEENINTYWNEGSGGYYLAEDALNYSVKTAPTADVVPKSEVEKIFEEIGREIKLALESNYKVRPQIEQSETMYNTVSGKIDALRGMDGFIAELKQKYIKPKVCTDCKHFLGCECFSGMTCNHYDEVGEGNE